MRLGCSYFGNRILRYVKQDMEKLAADSFDYVVHTFSENDWAFYHKRMQEIIKATHDAGLEAYVGPWGVGKMFGGEAFSDALVIKPHYKQILNDGDPAGIACLNHPEVMDFMKKWVDAAVETGADYIFWDEPHFYLSTWLGGRPNTWGCRCNFCKEKYKKQYNQELPITETETVVEFKQKSLYEFLSSLVNYAISKKIKNCLCSLPVEETNEKFWDILASIKGLDNFGTDPYWYAFKKDVRQFVGSHSKKVVQLTKNLGKETHIWIQGFKVPGGREEEIYTAVEEAVKAGVKDLAVWGFEACDAISYIRPENPQKTWEIILEAFKNAKKIS